MQEKRSAGGPFRSERALRALNVFVAVIGLILAAPLMLVIAVLIKLTSKGPVLYKQPRVGLDRRRGGRSTDNWRRKIDYGGKIFEIYKFRTMVVDADKDGQRWASPSDPRVTPIGRILRQYRLDELPQLFNVLRGHMSLVGPRPPLPHEVAAYEERMRRRLLVKPGMTGLWQVTGRSDLSWEESVRLDVYYAENWTPFLDLLILAQTARAVVSGRGAY